MSHLRQSCSSAGVDGIVQVTNDSSRRKLIAVYTAVRTQGLLEWRDAHHVADDEGGELVVVEGDDAGVAGEEAHQGALPTPPPRRQRQVPHPRYAWIIGVPLCRGDGSLATPAPSILALRRHSPTPDTSAAAAITYSLCPHAPAAVNQAVR